MTNTNKALLTVGGLALSYALVALDCAPLTSPQTPEATPAGNQQVTPGQKTQGNPFAQGLFWR